ncbi:MAG TPA: DUF4259 domain-containing protein [Gemmatimonadales bacterium]|nr:DUF4259 domain-containing protein [Gemmatimonadales bacterium]
MSEDWGHVFNGEATVKFWSPAAAQVLQQQHITKLRVHGWKQPTVEALGPFAHQLERIFWEVHDPTDVPDLSALAQLHQLNYLTLTHGLDQIDFSRLTALRTLGASADAPQFGNVRSCRSLRTLYLTNCGLRDLMPLAGLDQLTEVNVGEAPLKSLAGMNELRGLRRLALVQVPLASLDGIEDLQAIEDIYIHMLGRLQSIAPLTGLSRLKRLKLLQLDNVGPVPSLAFLRGLDKLETFYPSQGTKIEDGDLAVLLELPALTRVLFTNRKHYTHTCGDIQHALIARSTRDVGAFDNAASQIWFETLGQRNPVSWLGNTIGTALAFPPPKDVPALMAQYEIAAVELLALLAGRAGQGINYPEAVTTWLATHSVEPLGWLIERAVQSLDRIVTPPSGLLEIWTDRGEVKRWRAALHDLKGRVLAINISR